MRYFLVSYEWSGGGGQLHYTGETFPTCFQFSKFLLETHGIGVQNVNFTFTEILIV